MILVDTSVWIDHLQKADTGLVTLLERNAVLSHPCVIGELAMGRMARRAEVLGLLQALPKATIGTDAEVLELIEGERLFGRGLGYVDAQLLASTVLTPEATLWTRDRRLEDAARRIGCTHN